MEPISREELTAALKDAMKPLLDEMKEMRTDIQSLKLTAVPRDDVYSRDVMDEKLGAVKSDVKALTDALKSELTTLSDAIKASKEFTWKVLGAIGSVIMLAIYFLPHLGWH